MAHGPGLTYLFLYGTFLFRFGIGQHPILSFSFCPICHPNPWPPFSPIPASSVEIFVNNDPSAASKPKRLCLFQYGLLTACGLRPSGDLEGQGTTH